MSLDRNSFSSPDIGLLHNLVTKEKGCRCNGEKSELPYGNSAETNADNAVVRSGLKRLFQIAVSTVDGQRRPGAKIKDVLDLLESKGIRLSDPRMRETFRRIDAEPKGAESELTIETFSRICSPSFHFIRGVLLSQLTIPGMSIFKLRMERIFDKIKKILQQQPHQPTGSIDPFSNYNVMMRRRKSHHTVSLALCTVDGQRLSFGDKETPHPLNACATMFNYCLAHAQNGPEVMLHYLGKEPKPEDKGELTFNSDGKVWNPLTKSGAFMTSCLVFREMAVEERLDALHAFYDTLSGHEPLCCDNLSYNFKRSYAHEEIGAAYNLSSTQRLPRGTSEFIAEALDFHFQSSSTAMTSDACAVSAATLANNGICPLTGRVVVQQSSVEATLHTMRTCEPDIHAQAGERLQGVAGGWSENGSIMLVVPGVVGITCFTHCQSLHTIKQVVRCLFEVNLCLWV
nr:putative glutaminase 2 [Ciona intestinalis]|eukprot:XP_002123081.3 putative glutaminase 2 [Ciona intestinalis]